MTARLRFTVTEEHTQSVFSLTAAEIRQRYPDFREQFPEDSDTDPPSLIYKRGGRQWQIEPEVGA